MPDYDMVRADLVKPGDVIGLDGSLVGRTVLSVSAADCGCVRLEFDDDSTQHSVWVVPISWRLARMKQEAAG